MAHHSVARGRKAPHSRERSRDVRDIEVADALRALIRKDECTSHGADKSALYISNNPFGPTPRLRRSSTCAGTDWEGSTRAD